MASKAERISQLQAELDELMNSAEEEVSESLSDAEEEVTEVADTVNDETKEAHESVAEAEHEVEQAVEETAQETAEELGHPELVNQIADELFRRMEEAGKLPHQQSHSAPERVEADIETAAPVVPEAQEEVQEVRDTPPEPQHWYYRKRKIGRMSV